MPFNLDLQGILLKHATAQPLARMEHEGVTHVFFFERAGIQCEYCFAGASVAAVENSGGSQESAGTITVRPPAGASAGAFSVRGRNGAQVVFHTLTEEESLGFYKLHLFGRERALITNADAFESLGALTLRARDPVSPVSLLVFPPVASGLMAKGKTLESAVAGQFRRYNVQMAKGAVACAVRMRGPADAEITLPAGAFAEANEVFLRIEYDGDVGSAFIDGKLIADDFSNGEPWEIGLEKLLPEVLRKSICVHITPRREGSLIVKEAGMAVQQKLQGKEVAEIRSITATVERETRIFSA
jgi:hypothetical protein